MLLTGCSWFNFYIFHVVDRWLQLFTWLDPTSVQIKACQVAPAIAIDDAVRIQHRYDLENEVIPQNLSI